MRLVSPLIRNQSRRLKWIRCRRVTKWNLIRLALGVCQLIPTHKNKHTHAKDEIPVFKYRVDEKENGFKSEKHRRRQLVLYLWYEKIADHIFVKILQMAWDEASMNQNIAHNIFPNNLERYPRYIGRQRLFDSHSGCDINRYLRNLTLRSHQNMSKTYKHEWLGMASDIMKNVPTPHLTLSIYPNLRSLEIWPLLKKPIFSWFS